MREFRPLTSVTEEELRALVTEAFEGELIEVVSITEKTITLTIRTSGWDLEEEDNPKGYMEDEVTFTLGYGWEGSLVDLPFSGHGEEQIWQEFLIFFGFHPFYRSNFFALKYPQLEAYAGVKDFDFSKKTNEVRK